MSDGNFQDFVRLSSGSLYHTGEQFQLGSSTASTVTFAFSNSGGILALVALQTGNGTLTVPGGVNGTLGLVTAVSAGTQLQSNGGVVLSNSNNVSFGMSNSSVVTASVASSLTGINVSAGTTSNNLSAFTLSNSNNVSFGLNASTITASVTVASTQASINLSAGTTSNLSSAFTFSNGSNVSFGLNAGTITASVASSLTAINVSAGTTSNNLTALTFANGNGVTFGLNASTITASVVVPGAAVSVTAFSQAWGLDTNFPGAVGTLSLQKVTLPMNLSATKLALLADVEGFTNSTGAITISHAVYTISSGTASLASSGSRAFSWTSGSATTATSVYGGVSGTRYRTVGVNYSLTPGDYLFAWWISTANSASVNLFGRNAASIVGTYDGAETVDYLDGLSVSSVAAFPASIALTNTNYQRTGVAALRQPGCYLVGTGG